VKTRIFCFTNSTQNAIVLLIQNVLESRELRLCLKHVAANISTVVYSKKQKDEFHLQGTITRHILSLVTLSRVTVYLQFYSRALPRDFKLVSV